MFALSVGASAFCIAKVAGRCTKERAMMDRSRFSLDGERCDRFKQRFRRLYDSNRDQRRKILPSP